MEERIALQSVKEHPASLYDQSDNHSYWESGLGGEDSSAERNRASSKLV